MGLQLPRYLNLIRLPPFSLETKGFTISVKFYCVSLECSGFWMPGTQERRLSQKYYKVPAIKHCKRSKFKWDGKLAYLIYRHEAQSPDSASVTIRCRGCREKTFLRGPQCVKPCRFPPCRCWEDKVMGEWTLLSTQGEDNKQLEEGLVLFTAVSAALPPCGAGGWAPHAFRGTHAFLLGEDSGPVCPLLLPQAFCAVRAA